MAKILIVDDSVENLRVLGRMLEFGGHVPLSAADGREALDKAATEGPDLVLMDLAMPDMDGWTATALFRADEDLRHVPIIAVTGHVTRDEIDRAQEVGCCDVVSKPIDYYVLMDKLRKHIGDIPSAVAS